MNRMTWISIVAVAAVCALGSPAQAADPGFYVTATVGTSDEDPKSNGTNFASLQGVIHVDPDQVDVDDGGVAWGLGLGYRINDHLAGELEYADFGTTDIHEHYTVPNVGPIVFPTGIDVNYSTQVTGPVVSLLGTLPVGQRFELFLRGGVLFASREYRLHGQISFGGQEQKFADTVWLAGAGASWSLAKHVGIRAEYQQSGELEKSLVTGGTKVKRVSVSAIYRF